MYDIVVTWHDITDNVVCAVMYRGDKAPDEDSLQSMSYRIPVDFSTVVVSLTPSDSFELVAIEVYEVFSNGIQN